MCDLALRQHAADLCTLPATVDGVSLTLASGTPNAGDQFLLRPTLSGASAIAVAIADPARIAAAAPIRAARAAANTGTATISAGAVNAPPPPSANLQQTVTITFTSATTFDVTGVGTGNPTSVAYTSGAPITYNGWTAAIGGAPATGDTFTVSANAGGISDNRNALLLAAKQTQATVGNGTATYQGAYGQLRERWAPRPGRPRSVSPPSKHSCSRRSRRSSLCPG
jgi:flagellar hook-associated protein 1 FlgK